MTECVVDEQAATTCWRRSSERLLAHAATFDTYVRQEIHADRLDLMVEVELLLQAEAGEIKNADAELHRAVVMAMLAAVMKNIKRGPLNAMAM